MSKAKNELPDDSDREVGGSTPSKQRANDRKREQLALSLAQKGKLPEAEAAYKELIRLDNKNYIAHANLGAIYLMQGRHEESEFALKAALKRTKMPKANHRNTG